MLWKAYSAVCMMIRMEESEDMEDQLGDYHSAGKG